MAARQPNDARIEADESFERLYRGHRKDVFRAAFRQLGNVHDAEDVTQAAFVDAYRAVLRGSRPEAPRAWLLAIAENVRRRRFRTSLRRPAEEPLDIENAPAAEPALEQATAIRGALAALPQQQRDVFLLREIVGLSYAEIADGVGLTVGAVQMLLFRARQALRAELDPPQVAAGRAYVLPLPGWVTALASRTEPFVLTPKVAGAVGAAAVAAGGFSVGMPGSTFDRSVPRHASAAATVPAEPRRPSAVRSPISPAIPVAQSTRANPPGKRPSTRVAEPGPRRAAAPSRVPREPARPNVAAPPAPAQSPKLDLEPKPEPSAAERRATTPEPLQLEPPALAAPVLPAPPPASLGVPSVPSVPSVPGVPELEAELVEAGAAAVAGADGPPLPALPPTTLPPVP